MHGIAYDININIHTWEIYLEILKGAINVSSDSSMQTIDGIFHILKRYLMAGLFQGANI